MCNTSVVMRKHQINPVFMYRGAFYDISDLKFSELSKSGKSRKGQGTIPD